MATGNVTITTTWTDGNDTTCSTTIAISNTGQPEPIGKITISTNGTTLKKHKVLLRQDSQYKGKTLIVNKTVLQYAKTVIRFHDAYLLGKPVQLSCEDENTLKTFCDIYKLGQYDSVDYQIIDRVNKFGDAYEAVYVDNGIIKSKILDNACAYPVYDDMGNYISFIEHFTDVYTSITYWDVYYPNYVEHWNNEGGEVLMIS